MSNEAVMRPPSLPFVLSVGVTGHRHEAIANSGSEASLGERVETALHVIAARAAAVREREAAFFSDQPTRLVFLSALADGADQIAAQAALEFGFELHVILPFARAEYRESLTGDPGRARFDQLIERAACVLDLPGNPDNRLEAYIMTGRAIVAHCDILLALWDGEAPRGRGGTGEVVQLALTAGTPVVHVPTDEHAPARMLWSAFDPATVTREIDEASSRPFDEANVDTMLSLTVAPPADPDERRFLDLFARERMRRIRARVEYPLMLAAAGVKRFRARDVRESYGAEDTRAEWESYREDCARRHSLEPSLDLLEAAYSWSDRLATYFAQTYRSGHIFNFVLGAVAVCVGLASNMLNQGLLEFAIGEGMITAAIILNTWMGMRNEWHRRWLDYRQLAERLRPMRSLKLLAIAAPDPPGSVTEPVPRRWIDWYAAGVWRALGPPAGRLTREQVSSLVRAICDYEVSPQVAYHHRHASQIEQLDERLEKIAGGLFWITLMGSLFVIVGLATHPDVVNRYGDWLTLIGAGFPALGTAIFGIRFQGDFGGSALRSLATANALARIEGELKRDIPLGRAADLTEQAARTMLGDLEEWRLVNQQQELDLL